MNWGDNLTLVGAIRVDRWLTMATSWGAMNTTRFVAWVSRYLVGQLRPGDVVLLDNLAPHKARRVRDLIEAAGATLRFLPPYSHDYNPIEAAWALIKKRIRAVAPRTARRCASPLSVPAESCAPVIATIGSLMRVTNSSDLWG
jgi:transposase